MLGTQPFEMEGETWPRCYEVSKETMPKKEEFQGAESVKDLKQE